MFPRNEVEGWVNDELHERTVGILGMDVASRSIDLVATPNEFSGNNVVVGLFVRDGEVVEKITYEDGSSGAEAMRVQRILDAVYPPVVLLDDLVHRQGIDVTFRRTSAAGQDEAIYIFESCFDG